LPAKEIGYKKIIAAKYSFGIDKSTAGVYFREIKDSMHYVAIRLNRDVGA
jgi:hypothetical protein